MNAIIDRQPDVQTLEKELADVHAAEHRFADLAQREGRKHAEAMREYEAAKNAALDAGEVPPTDEPVPTITQADVVRKTVEFAQRKQAIDRRRRQVLADLLPVIQDEARDVYDDAIERARPLVDALGEIAHDVRTAQSALHTATAAAASLSNTQRTEVDPPTAATPEALVAAIRHGANLLAMRQARPLGLTPGTLHAVHDVPEPTAADKAAHQRRIEAIRNDARGVPRRRGPY